MGSGEALNEHILGDPWPSAGVRLQMLAEAVEVIRKLHQGGEVSHHGKHYEVQEARIYTRPEQPVPIYVSAFGPQAVRLAARIGDGYSISMPDGELVKQFREAGGGDKPVQGGTKVCWDADADAALKTTHRLWGNEGLLGQTSQILLRPKDFAAPMPLVPRTPSPRASPAGPTPIGTSPSCAATSTPTSTRSTCSRSARTWTGSSRPGSRPCCPRSATSGRGSARRCAPLQPEGAFEAGRLRRQRHPTAPLGAIT